MKIEIKEITEKKYITPDGAKHNTRKEALKHIVFEEIKEKIANYSRHDEIEVVDVMKILKSEEVDSLLRMLYIPQEQDTPKTDSGYIWVKLKEIFEEENDCIEFLWEDFLSLLSNNYKEIYNRMYALESKNLNESKK